MHPFVVADVLEMPAHGVRHGDVREVTPSASISRSEF